MTGRMPGQSCPSVFRSGELLGALHAGCTSFGACATAAAGPDASDAADVAECPLRGPNVGACPLGGTGRRNGLKIRFPRGSGGSSPPAGTSRPGGLERSIGHYGTLRMDYRDVIIIEPANSATSLASGACGSPSTMVLDCLRRGNCSRTRSRRCCVVPVKPSLRLSPTPISVCCCWRKRRKTGSAEDELERMKS